jgi:hypothetical protein
MRKNFIGAFMADLAGRRSVLFPEILGEDITAAAEPQQLVDGVSVELLPILLLL